ncbi:hypothetical protein ZWY2020_044455 [Hordeum vulgare]|nr:hypothetical protein ZWY2020_044455 [Hordeum vulgare]
MISSRSCSSVSVSLGLSSMASELPYCGVPGAAGEYSSAKSASSKPLAWLSRYTAAQHRLLSALVGMLFAVATPFGTAAPYSSSGRVVDPKLSFSAVLCTSLRIIFPIITFRLAQLRRCYF